MSPRSHKQILRLARGDVAFKKFSKSTNGGRTSRTTTLVDGSAGDLNSEYGGASFKSAVM